MFRRLTLSLRIVLPGLLFFATTAAIGILYVAVRMDQEALREARTIARLILERNLATHSYFNAVLKPHVFRMAEELANGPGYDPVWMSSTHAVREIDTLFQQQSAGLNYYYKECAVNARSPANEADITERAVLERMKADPNLQEWTERREFDGEPYYVYMLRGESMESSCLRCHSGPDSAPAELVHAFGPDRSFGREVGELVSAISIRIPMGRALTSSASVTRDISVALVFTLAVMGLAQWLSVDRAVVQPLKNMCEEVAAVAADSSRISTSLTLPGAGKEVHSLADSFNRMAHNVRQHQAELERRVTERTLELEQANLALAKEVVRRGEAEKAANTERDKFRTLFEQAIDTVLLLRVDEEIPVIVDINRAGLDLHGIKKDQIVGKPVSHLDTAETAGEARNRLKQVLEHGEAHFAVTHRVVGNRRLHIDVQAKLIDLGGIPHVLAVERDMTERFELEQRVRESQKLQAIGTLAGGIAHDFNNALAVVIGYSQMLLERSAEGSEDREDITGVLQAARRARDLVKQILTFSRGSEGQPELISCGGIVADAMELLRHTLPSSVHFDQHLCDGGDTILADADQIRQLVMHLCTNAYHAVPKEGGHIEVSLAPVVADQTLRETFPELIDSDYILLSVTDNGQGMTAETKARIFEPFFTTKPVGQGSGMGMAVVHGIVRNLRGAIVINSEPGQGTTVDVYLPLHLNAVEHRNENTAAERRGSERILVIDDEPALARMQQRLLEALGYSVEAFVSSRDALERFQNADPGFDLVITDQTMPGMSGTRLVEEILQVRPRTPILLCTGNQETLAGQSAETIGVATILRKPVDSEDLTTAIRTALNRA